MCTVGILNNLLWQASLLTRPMQEGKKQSRKISGLWLVCVSKETMVF